MLKYVSFLPCWQQWERMHDTAWPIQTHFQPSYTFDVYSHDTFFLCFKCFEVLKQEDLQIVFLCLFFKRYENLWSTMRICNFDCSLHVLQFFKFCLVFRWEINVIKAGLAHVAISNLNIRASYALSQASLMPIRIGAYM